MDARIPIVFGSFGDVVPPDTAVLARFETPVRAFSGCACCAPRGDAARALGALFHERARGKVAFFRQVLVIADDAAALRAELEADVLVSARYRIVPAGDATA